MFERELGERVMILLAGRVKISRLGADGRETLLSIRDPGDVVGELAFVDGEPRIASVTALEPIEALLIPEPAFRAHLERTPRVAVALLEVVTSRCRQRTVTLTKFNGLDTLGRLAVRIVELVDRYGEAVDGGIEIATPLSQEELAGWIGASRASLAAALQALRELGWIETGRRRLLVRDLDAVRRRSGEC
jgi:CRP-like cAMP-binding protein